jgi:elongation factor G
MSELQSHRSVIEGMDTEGHFQRIKARIPLSETNSFASSLRSLTQGKSKYALRFLDFFPVSGELQAKLIAEHEQLSIEK